MIRGDPVVGTVIRQNPRGPREQSYVVLGIRPYDGPLDFVSCIVKLSSKNGPFEMSWEKGDHHFWEVES